MPSQSALETFLVKKNQLDILLKRLQSISDEHFCLSPDEINWGHVGDIGHLLDELTEATESTFNQHP